MYRDICISTTDTSFLKAGADKRGYLDLIILGSTGLLLVSLTVGILVGLAFGVTIFITGYKTRQQHEWESDDDASQSMQSFVEE